MAQTEKEHGNGVNVPVPIAKLFADCKRCKDATFAKVLIVS